MKLEQAARQALGALVRAEAMYGQPNADIQTALREALAEQVHTPYCKQAPMCKTPCGNSDCVEQAEQEPVAVVEITYGREPECYVTGNIDDFPEGVFKLYTHPVRVQDLTDEEIMDLVRDECVDMRWPSTPLFIARAVIAKFKEKNRG